MNRLGKLLGLSLLAACGCAKPCPPCPPVVPSCHQYQAPGFNWSSVRRILLVPLVNESTYPQAILEIQESLAARMQCGGRFEVVLATPDSHPACFDALRSDGHFDEVELIDLAMDYNVDAVLFGAITQYVPYTPPRVGLSLRLISPANGSLIASVDGLWDSRERAVADQARCYASLTLTEGPTLAGSDIAIDSPAVFRRFACHYAVEALVNPVQTPAISFDPNQPPPPNGGPITPIQATEPAPGSAPVPFPPPVPPAPAEPDESSPSPADNSPPTPILPALPVDLPDDTNQPEPGGGGLDLSDDRESGN